mmetsp:Transcript_12902/g.24369  ORF Transcript_12902/g.24369 Transcript_12902/m.24369 type:complete len:88 (-) Transcript_12902:201-464(-)
METSSTRSTASNDGPGDAGTAAGVADEETHLSIVMLDGIPEMLQGNADTVLGIFGMLQSCPRGGISTKSMVMLWAISEMLQGGDSAT